MTRKLLLLCVSLSLAACARSTASQRPAAGEASGMAFKSSLMVLLEHRGELALTAGQVERFAQMDFTLHEKNAALQQRIDSLRVENKKNERPWNGGYMGGGLHDAHGGKGGDMAAPPEAIQEKLKRRERLEHIESTLREMQDNDSQAYVEAEKLLDDTQKPRAREFFSREREKLLKQFEAMHYQLRKEEY